MLRRNLLKTTALTPFIAVLASCAGKSPSADLAQVVTDISTIAAGLAGVLPNLAKVVGITSENLANVQMWIADLQQAAQQISSVTTVAGAQPIVQQVETDVNAVVAALSGLPLPPPLNTVLLAASILLPVVETAVGLLVPPAAPSMAMARGATMTPAQARLVLRAAANH